MSKPRVTTARKRKAKPRKISWYVCDNGVRMSDCRKELTVNSSGAINNWSHHIEETHYTGQFTVKGRSLATRLCKLLNDVEQHSARYCSEVT